MSEPSFFLRSDPDPDFFKGSATDPGHLNLDPQFLPANKGRNNITLTCVHYITKENQQYFILSTS